MTSKMENKATMLLIKLRRTKMKLEYVKMKREAQKDALRYTCTSVSQWSSIVLLLRYSSSSLQRSSLVASSQTILSFRTYMTNILGSKFWIKENLQRKAKKQGIGVPCKTWISLLGAPPLKARSSACKNSSCCRILCISADIGFLLTWTRSWKKSRKLHKNILKQIVHLDKKI